MIVIDNISKIFTKGSDTFKALDGISFNINKGDFCSVTGSSGAGKSTLLYVIGGLIRPDSGSVLFNGSNIYSKKAGELDRYRRNHLGFMFQQFHLMPYLTVYENIRLACHERKDINNIDYYIRKCSLEDLQKKYPSELSVGEKQRTAFIRAIISAPDILLADEPTGNLDQENSDILIGLVKEYQEKGGTVVIVSHNLSMAGYATRNVVLNKGRMK